MQSDAGLPARRWRKRRTAGVFGPYGIEGRGPVIGRTRERAGQRSWRAGEEWWYRPCTDAGGSRSSARCQCKRHRRPVGDPMPDTTVKKIDSTHSPRSEAGAKYLASGKSLSMRLWEKEPPSNKKPESRREYETV